MPLTRNIFGLKLTAVPWWYQTIWKQLLCVTTYQAVTPVFMSMLEWRLVDEEEWGGLRFSKWLRDAKQNGSKRWLRTRFGLKVCWIFCLWGQKPSMQSSNDLRKHRDENIHILCLFESKNCYRISRKSDVRRTQWWAKLCPQNYRLLKINHRHLPSQAKRSAFVNGGGKDMFQSHLTVMGESSEGC